MECILVCLFWLNVSTLFTPFVKYLSIFPHIIPFATSRIPAFKDNFFLNLYKGKSEALDCGNYDGLKLTDQVMKLLEQMVEVYTSKMVNIDVVQLGFVVEIPLTPYSSPASCSRIYLPITHRSTLLSTLRRHWIRLRSYAEKDHVVGLVGPWCWLVGFTCHRSHVLQCPVLCVGQSNNTAMDLEWDLVCIRALSIAHWSSSWCWKCFQIILSLVYHGSLAMLMTQCWPKTPNRSCLQTPSIDGWHSSSTYQFNIS